MFNFNFTKSGKVAYNTFTETIDGVAITKLAMIELILQAFVIEGSTNPFDDFSVATKDKIVKMYNLKKRPQSLSSIHSKRQLENEKQARALAWALYIGNVRV